MSRTAYLQVAYLKAIFAESQEKRRHEPSLAVLETCRILKNVINQELKILKPRERESVQ